MQPHEYKKVIDVLATALGAGKAVDLHYSHDSNHKIDLIDITLTTVDEEKLECRVYLRPRFLEIAIPKKFLTSQRYARFLSRLEYDLEQAFLRNIHLESNEETVEYRVKVHS